MFEKVRISGRLTFCQTGQTHVSYQTWQLQRGNGTLRNGLGSKLRAIYVIGSVGVDLAGRDGHVSATDSNPTALKANKIITSMR